MGSRRTFGGALACGALLLAGCQADLKCGPLEVDEERRLCICPNGGRHMDGLCILDDGSVTPLDAGTSDAGAWHDDAGPLDAGASDACVVRGAELCDGSGDEDCDGTVDEGCDCTTGAEMPCGTTDVGPCAFGIQRCVDGAWSECEGVLEPSVETCNETDDDCDGNVDEDVATSTYYRDSDGDTYGSDDDTRIACRAPGGYVAQGGDCVDGNADVHPGQTAYFTVPIAGAPAGREYDYDCDGSITREHRANSLLCSYNALAGRCNSLATGYFYVGLDPEEPRGPDCGASGLYRTACVSSGAQSCESVSEPRVQACR